MGRLAIINCCQYNLVKFIMTNNQEGKTDRKPNIWKLTRCVFRAFDILRFPCIFEFFWHILTKVSPLNQGEIEAASEMFGPNPSRFNTVRIAQGRLLNIVFLFNRKRPFVTFHTINYSRPRDNSRKHLADIIHELTHVYQFELVGTIYLWEALRAQWKWKGKAYDYGTWQELIIKRNQGWHFRDYCREQQAKMAEVYYRDILSADTPISDNERQAYEPFIHELRHGDL